MGDVSEAVDLVAASRRIENPVQQAVRGALSAGRTPRERRAIIQAYEKELYKHPQAEIPVEHWFADGVYVRQITIPPDCYLTGKIHKEECISIISRGDLMVFTEDGERRVVGPCVYKSPPGTKRAGYTFTETIWLTVHRNPDNIEGDPEVMAAHLTVETFDELLEYQRKILEAHG